MFDFGLTKLILIGAVALIVIGPEKLPTIARMAGSLLGRMQRYIRDLKSEINREIELEELRKIQGDIHQEFKMSDNTRPMENFQNQLPPAGSATQIFSSLNEGAALSSTVANAKYKNFRHKKLLLTSSIPSWYKNSHKHKTSVMSGAARIVRYRAKNFRSTGAYFSYARKRF